MVGVCLYLHPWESRDRGSLHLTSQPSSRNLHASGDDWYRKTPDIHTQVDTHIHYTQSTKSKKKLYALHLDSEILLGKEIKRIKESSQRQPKRKKKDIHQNIGKNRFVRSDKTAYFLLQIIAQFLSQITRDLRIKFKSSRQQVRAQPCCCPRCDLAQLAAEPQFT